MKKQVEQIKFVIEEKYENVFFWTSNDERKVTDGNIYFVLIS